MQLRQKKEQELFQAIENQNVSHLSEILEGIEKLRKISLSLETTDEQKLFQESFIPDINTMKDCGCMGWQVTPLTKAVNQPNEIIISKLISAKADVNKPDSDGTTPLMLAASRGKLGLINTLLKEKADVNRTDLKGDSALYFAAIKGRTECLEVLLAAGEHAHDALAMKANVNNAFLVAAESCELDCISLLLKVKADVNSYDEEKETAIIKLFRYSKKENILKCLPVLLEAKANIEMRNKENKTALFYAVENREIELIRLLVEAGAKVNYQNSPSILDTFVDLLDYSGEEILSDEDLASIVRLLLEKGAIFHSPEKLLSFPTKSSPFDKPHPDVIFFQEYLRTRIQPAPYGSKSYGLLFNKDQKEQSAAAAVGKSSELSESECMLYHNGQYNITIGKLA